MLVALDRIQNIHLVPAIIILSREILVSGLREFLATIPVALPVTKAAKYKTVLQMVAIGCLIFNQTYGEWISAQSIGLGFLWISAILTLMTGYDYMKAGFRHMGK